MDLQGYFPGCMGRMINLFDLSAGMARTKMLTERPHRDVIRNCSDVVKEQMYPVETEIEGKQIVSEKRSSYPNKKSGGTPIKMLISQEMWGDTASRQKAPSVVARLMGLDSLPAQQSLRTDRKSRSKGCSCNSLTGELQHYRQHEDGYVDNSVLCESQSFTHEKKVFRDVYEVQQQPSQNVWVKEQSAQKARYDETSYQRRMSLVRQKFIEAKRLATDEKLIDSKEFQDAVEVLNSNRDLFIKLLEEPNSLLAKHLCELERIPVPSQKTRITVLKPSNTMEKKGDNSMERQLLTDSGESVGKGNKHYWSPGFSEPKVQNLPQPTRIVVLKPSPAKSDDIKATLPNNSPTLLGGRVSSGAVATDELVGSREVAKEITRQMRESTSSNRDEALLSSVLSNGYIGDESSFNRSESEYMEDEVGSLSDSEIATPATEYSWDYINNKIGSPFSASSCTQASHSPESSVIREAKKRLSERLALVASRGSSQEQRQLWRTSSTLGEMLAIPELKKEGCKEYFTLLSSKSSNGEDDPRVPSALLSTFGAKDEHSGENSHRNLSRSKSAPLSPSAEVDDLNVGNSTSFIGKPIVQTEVPKSNNGRSSFKDKVSSFLFSRSKKPSAEKPPRSLPVLDDRVHSGNSNGSGKRNDVLSQSVNDAFLAQTKLVSPDKLNVGSTEGTPFPKDGPSLSKTKILGNFTQNQDQSSQISPLEAPLVDDVNNGLSQSAGSIIAGCPQALSRSPPIESVARSLSWSASYSDIASAKLLKSSTIFSKADEEHEQYMFVKRLISSAGIDSKKGVIFGGWHSLDSPLNPLLLYESMHMNDEEGKCRERRSSCRLLFDAVNAALLDIGQSALFAVYPWTGACHGPRKEETAGAAAAAEVWTIVRNGLSGEKCVPSESSGSSMVVERLVRKEVAGRQWAESRCLEACEFSEEIGGKVLEELVEEILSELSCH